VSFAEVKGQDRAVAFLRSAAAGDRISSAYIFFGPAGVGKKLAALNFAKALNCLAQPEARPCDTCVSCRKADGGNHPDIMLVKPEKAGASLKIDTVRQLINQTALKAYEGRKKVYIIDGASALTREATSALLKTLEEPASDSVLVMLFENLRYVPRTILSRSQMVKFFPMNSVQMKAFLIDERKLDPAKAELIAGISAGRIADALGLADEAVMLKRKRLIDAISKKAFFDIDFDKMPKEELKASLDAMLSWYRDLLVAKASAGACPSLINVDRMDLVCKTAARTDGAAIASAIEDIIDALSHLDGNANAKLVMGVLGAKIAQ